MPLYDYRCSACGHTVEVRHGFDETYDALCERCGGVLTRVFNPAPIVFKGSGFYVTDSRGGASGGEKAGGEKAAGGKPSEKSAPAPATASAATPAKSTGESSSAA